MCLDISNTMYSDNEFVHLIFQEGATRSVAHIVTFCLSCIAPIIELYVAVNSEVWGGFFEFFGGRNKVRGQSFAPSCHPTVRPSDGRDYIRL